MEASALLRMIASLGLVLGMMAAILWAVRRFDIRLPGRSCSAARLQVMERLSLDPKNMVVILRRDHVEHLLILGPAGAMTIEGTIKPSKCSANRPGSEPPRASPTVSRPNFAMLVKQHLLASRRRLGSVDQPTLGAPCDIA
ncbi:flagellar biosynthetic protein FliO [Sphingomonas sp. KRR8]|uniref:FliO/MopB family protein n=1 Tax=Sphingomonas sp. KRR8 TaxID=2942996 RepID=UPI00201FDF9B|nr:flagellar biosynthetic protein FliO [Sphingomonas sp. KRR8]URD61913.1 flagellar biosynthetic protein FliO [Sphingomonas sp. KRR8]